MRLSYAAAHEKAQGKNVVHAKALGRYASGMSKKGIQSSKKKTLFQPFQVKILLDTIEKNRKKFKNQTDLAKALGLTQPALSNLLNHKWKPGMTTALAVAELEGVELVDLIGPFQTDEDRPSGLKLHVPGDDRLPNVDVCVSFWRGRKTWSPWTVAAAKAGLFGDDDVPSPEWEERLDRVERVLLPLRAKN